MKLYQVIFVLLFVLGGSYFSSGQTFNPSKMKDLLYGVAYYHENMPYERLETDVKLMKECGINVVRIAESSWGNMEPHDGEFDFEWLDKVIDAMGKANIRIIVGTPTYSIPTWLAKEHPEIIWDGYGMRQNMDLSSSVYRFYSERVIRKLIAHVCKNPAVIGYQIDNETKYLGTTGDSLQIKFIDAMKKKFGTTDTLNKAWGLAYWGQKINAWDDFPKREGATSPSYKLEWDRFTRNTVTDFLAWQAKIVNEYKRPDQFITLNFDGQTVNGTPGPNTLNNTFDIAKVLDITGFDIYHGSQNALDGTAISLFGDWARSSKQTNYLILETNIQTQSWSSE
jgi:beta-galactosidase